MKAAVYYENGTPEVLNTRTFPIPFAIPGAS